MKALPKDLRYLLFDLDGTLTDSAEGILRCVQYALEQCGTPEPDAEKLRPFIGPPLLDSFQEFCGMPPARAAFAVEQYRKRFSTVGLLENAVYDGIPELLEQLREHGYVLAVATSKPEVYTLRILEHFDLFKYFTAVAGGHDSSGTASAGTAGAGAAADGDDRRPEARCPRSKGMPCALHRGAVRLRGSRRTGTIWCRLGDRQRGNTGKTAAVRTALYGIKALQNAVLFLRVCKKINRHTGHSGNTD